MTSPGHPGDHGPLGWREALSALDPMLARRPASSHAARLLAGRGQPAAALEVYREVLARHPEDVAARRALAALLRRLGRWRQARDELRAVCSREARALGVAPEDLVQVVDYLVAREAGDDPGPAPAAWLRAAFDGYAESFDEHLQKDLGYRGPRRVHELLTRELGAWLDDLAILDAGCGTGLAAPLLKPHARRLVGLDLSPGMLVRAHERGLYDALVEGALPAALTNCQGPHDLVVAMDVFVYGTDLAPLVAACREVLSPGGVLAFTVEVEDGDGVRPGRSSRFVHGREHVAAALAGCGLERRVAQDVILRQEGGRPVPSLVVLARRLAD